MRYPCILIGGGDHAKVLADMLLCLQVKLLGYADPIRNRMLEELYAVPYIGGDEEVTRYNRDEIRLINALGSVRSAVKRQEVFEKFKRLGYSFGTILHPTAILSFSARLEEGTQAMAGAIIQPNCQVGVNTMINTKASIDHDCQIGNHVHIASGATLCGNVIVEDGVHVGAGATIIQGVKVGKNSLIGAGAVVISDVIAGATVIGVPAKEVRP